LFGTYDILNFQELQMNPACMVSTMLTKFINGDIIHGQEKSTLLKLKLITPINLESYKWLLIGTSISAGQIFKWLLIGTSISAGKI
jgi:hypothetical protein